MRFEIRQLTEKLDHGPTSNVKNQTTKGPTPNVLNLIGELKKNFETFVADKTRSEPNTSKFSNELNEIKSEIENLKKERGNDKVVLDELKDLINRLDTDLINLRSTKMDEGSVKAQLDEFRSSMLKMSRRVEPFSFLGNLSNFLTSARTELNNDVTPGEGKNQTWVEQLGRNLEVLTANLESLKSDVSQMKGRSNSSTDFVRLSEKFEKMFSDTLTTLSKTMEEQKRLEEKVTIQFQFLFDRHLKGRKLNRSQYFLIQK